jgi:hypothetical protein
MQKRRVALRVAGWLAMLSGAVGLTAGALLATPMGGMVGTYGLLLIVAGAWTVIGIELVERHQRRSSRIPQAAGTTDQRGVVSR